MRCLAWALCAVLFPLPAAAQWTGEIGIDAGMSIMDDERPDTSGISGLDDINVDKGLALGLNGFFGYQLSESFEAGLAGDAGLTWNHISEKDDTLGIGEFLFPMDAFPIYASSHAMPALEVGLTTDTARFAVRGGAVYTDGDVITDDDGRSSQHGLREAFGLSGTFYSGKIGTGLDFEWIHPDHQTFSIEVVRRFN